jgi:Na+-transporting methylmalonyl-CoA/oxaloacetate decarboxylase gamma subunit
LFFLFILIYFVALLDAMSESTLDMLRIEAKEKQITRKAKSVKRE